MVISLTEAIGKQMMHKYVLHHQLLFLRTGIVKKIQPILACCLKLKLYSSQQALFSLVLDLIGA